MSTGHGALGEVPPGEEVHPQDGSQASQDSPTARQSTPVQQVRTVEGKALPLRLRHPVSAGPLRNQTADAPLPPP